MPRPRHPVDGGQSHLRALRSSDTIIIDEFKVGDIVIVNQGGDKYSYTKPGSYGVVERILAGG